MPKAWFTIIAASVCIVGVAATTAMADPASMAMFSRRPAQPATTSSSIWPWSSSRATTAAPAMPLAQSAPSLPSAEISPWQHPFKYIGASVSEMPVPWKFKTTTATNRLMHPAGPKTDSISLSVPTGPPSPEFFIYAAQMCERQNDVPQARQNLQRALAMWPGNADVLRAAARMEDRQGNLPLAETLYQQAVSSNPQNGAALNDLGLCLARKAN